MVFEHRRGIMPDTDEPREVGAVLDSVEHAGEGERVSVAEIVDSVGAGAFGPLLLVPAVILVTPVSGIPGMPTLGSLIISLIAGQIVIGRRCLWLPAFIRNRTISKRRLESAMKYLRKPSVLIDRMSRERLVFLTEKPLQLVPALICCMMVLFAPIFETVPFSVSLAAFAVSLFALGFVAKDGLWVALGLAIIAGGAIGGIVMLV
jgi:hypothetical protein